MLIYFLRHGDASSDSRLNDHDRPLTDRGVEQAELVNIYFQRMDIRIDVVLSSPLKRALQTATIAGSGISARQIATNELLENGTDHQQLIRHLNSLEISSALLVGHAPHLPEIISLLVNGDYESDVKMKKCSLGVVEVPKPISPGSGVLKQITHIDTIAKFVKP